MKIGRRVFTARTVFLLVTLVAVFFFCLDKENVQDCLGAAGKCVKLSGFDEGKITWLDHPRGPGGNVPVQSSVSFQDFVLLTLSAQLASLWANRTSVDQHCLYGSKTRTKLLAADNEFVRCEHPAKAVRRALVGRTVTLVVDQVVHHSIGKYGTINWDNVVYNMVLFADSDDKVLVFAKGIVRSKFGKMPKGLECVFGGQMRTEAVANCQENFVCKLPPLMSWPSLVGSTVTIGLNGDKVWPSVVRFPMSLVGNPPLPGKDFTSSVNSGKSVGSKYKVCACTMIWNGAKYLREWVLYHSSMGVDRFFVYDNNSEDDIEMVIDSLRAFRVSRHPWPWLKTQEAGFSHCAIQAAPYCTWLTFLDVDEFIFPKKFATSDAGRSALPPMQLLIDHFNKMAGNRLGQLKIPCYTFGPSGHRTLPKNGQMVSYACRLKSPKRVKSIVKVEAMDVSHCHRVHFAVLQEGFVEIRAQVGDTAVYHYKYSVWENFKDKFVHRAATFVTDWWERNKMDSTDRVPGLGTGTFEPAGWAHRFCEIWDTKLRDYVLKTFTSNQTGLLAWE